MLSELRLDPFKTNMGSSQIAPFKPILLLADVPSSKFSIEYSSDKDSFGETAQGDKLRERFRYNRGPLIHGSDWFRRAAESRTGAIGVIELVRVLCAACIYRVRLVTWTVVQTDEICSLPPRAGIRSEVSSDMTSNCKMAKEVGEGLGWEGVLPYDGGKLKKDTTGRSGKLGVDAAQRSGTAVTGEEHLRMGLCGA
nr:hypothetical protein Iba_chr08bCG12030 [Ipomoea batatas]